MATRNMSKRRNFLMRHIKKMVLHYFVFRALELIICKLYKLMQYVFCLFICVYMLFTYFGYDGFLPVHMGPIFKFYLFSVIRLHHR